MIGRAIDGVRVIGRTNHLEPVINEFAEHGVQIGRVIVGGDLDMIAEKTFLRSDGFVTNTKLDWISCPSLSAFAPYSRQSLKLWSSQASLQCWSQHRHNT